MTRIQMLILLILTESFEITQNTAKTYTLKADKDEFLPQIIMNGDDR